MSRVKKTVFNRLIGLYRKQPTAMRTPLEDFTTEVLASILESNETIMEHFLRDVVKIPENDLSSKSYMVKTQEHFSLVEDPDCRVDMTIRGEHFLCFIENKVNSSEGWDQLERYCKALDATSDVNTYLRYCTKFYDDKDIEAHDFWQFRWADVHEALTSYSNNDIVGQFLDFLRSHGMGAITDIQFEDLSVMEQVTDVFDKLNYLLEGIQHEFHRSTGRNAQSGNRYKQISQFHRYVCYEEYVLKAPDYSEIGFGFELGDVPSLYIWIWADETSKAWSDHKNHLKAQFPDESLWERGYLAFTKPIEGFLQSKDMEKLIMEWFKDIFEKIKQYDGFIVTDQIMTEKSVYGDVADER